MNLPEMFPQLACPDLVSKRFELEDAYRDYTQTVSPDDMAVSVQTAAYLLFLCRQLQAKTVVDFGSGFTSYVLGLYSAEAGATVRSVDDSEEWLSKTAAFLEKRGVRSNLHLWDDYKEMDLRQDVACWDLAGGKTREAGMGWVADHALPGGVIVYDDAHHAGHRQKMCQVSIDRDWPLFFLGQTIDDHSRFSALMVVPNG